MSNDLSTLAGQRAHYAEVRARLMGRPRRLPRPVAAPRRESAAGDARSPRLGATPHGQCGPSGNRASWQQILDQVCARHRIEPGLVTGADRRRHISAARFEVFYRIKTARPELSWARIGQLVGGFDPTTVLYGYRRYAERMLAGDASGTSPPARDESPASGAGAAP
jgi:Bacterial dnaA protein helix-turn-helix